MVEAVFYHELLRIGECQILSIRVFNPFENIMASIFISHSHVDQDYADALAAELAKGGHKVLYDGNILNPGSNWERLLGESLAISEVFVVLLSEASTASPNVMMEIGRAKALASTGDKLMIPVILDASSIPLALAEWQVVFAAQKHVAEVAGNILAGIAGFEHAKQDSIERKKEVREDLSKFADEAIETQKTVGKTNKYAAYVCYTGGALALFIGLMMTVDALKRAMDPATVFETSRMISAGIANVIAIGFLGALAKYGYSLGKSFMSESLKSSDRIHAIQFGQFYLKAFGSRLSPAEVRDAFQHWNIDRGSTFSTLDSAEIDPQIISVAGQLVAAVIGKKDDK